MPLPDSSTHPILHLSPDLPVDAVVFAPTRVDPPAPEPDSSPAPRTGHGAHRRARPRGRGGPLLEPRHQGNGHRNGAVSPDLRAHLAAAGLGPDRVTLVDADAAVEGTSRGRTLVVTRCPEMATGMTAAGHPVLILDDRPVHRVVLAWLSARVGPYAAASALVAPLDEAAGDEARSRHLRLTKPPGSLGRLEDIGAQLAAIAGSNPPPLPPRVRRVFVGDHGVYAGRVALAT